MELITKEGNYFFYWHHVFVWITVYKYAPVNMSRNLSIDQDYEALKNNIL